MKEIKHKVQEGNVGSSFNLGGQGRRLSRGDPNDRRLSPVGWRWRPEGKSGERWLGLWCAPAAACTERSGFSARPLRAPCTPAATRAAEEGRGRAGLKAHPAGGGARGAKTPPPEPAGRVPTGRRRGDDES